MSWAFVPQPMSDRQITAQNKALVAKRARYCCEYCLSQVAYSPDSFSIDHVVPRTVGGTNDLENLAFACLGCNTRKFTFTAAVDPVTGLEAPLYHPRHHQWHDHFMWDDDFFLLVGLTPTGRATIERLQLNRTGTVNLRIALSRIGKHPP